MMRLRALIEQYRFPLLVSCLVALSAGFLALALSADATHERQVAQSAQVQAQILADSISAALAFDDQAAITQYTSALRANPDVEAVAVFDVQGKLIAQVGIDATSERFPVGRINGASGAAIGISAPVLENGMKLGRVYFRQRTEAIGSRIRRFAGAALLLFVAALLLTVTGLDARALNRANQRLQQEMRERERAEAGLRQSQKMEAVGRLTGGIAHDFNNMLAVILGNNELLLRKFPDLDDKVLKFIANTQDAARRAATLTQRLLAFSRRQALDPKTVDPAHVILDLSDLLRRTLGETVAVQIVNAAGLWPVRIDVVQLETALVNLAVNARDAMPQGGKLTIESSNVYLDRRYTDALEDVTPGQYVLIAVTDTGTGMPEEVVAQVFEPFFTTKPVGQGTGLGLSQVHGFVKQSGGHVAIYSEPAHGTTVKLYLPRSAEDLQNDASDVTRIASRNRKNITVLLVDDEAGVRIFAEEALVELGYDVLVAEDASQAIRVVKAGGAPEILLTDVVMPGRSGRALADDLSKELTDLKVLYMTGYTQNAIVHNGVLDAGTRLLVKPFTLDQLGRELEALGVNHRSI
ncbi:MAG TPA: ATP-binding protein [Asticcacaulis sp.]|nr:ATP-binding protein [Asticcacaulis sp.]